MLITALSACGFHLRSGAHLAPPLQRMYLQTNDPYGYLARILKQFLNMSKVTLVSSPEQATTILTISKDANTQSLLNVSGTQQTRQYNLTSTVEFTITDAKGRTLVETQTLTESRTITIQSNQILGSSNEANQYYQQMQRSLVYAIINRLSSRDISQAVTKSSP
jgi:LPS-assembly lipoprotein